MPLYVKDSGSWETATEVYIKNNSLWTRCKEVYIKEDGQWKSLLFEDATETITTTGTGTFDVPQGAYRAIVTIAGGNGGDGGFDSRAGGVGGKGAEVTFVIDVEPFTTFSYNIGGDGQDGADSATYSTPSNGGSGYSDGGNGGRSGQVGTSGGGGGGGGSSSISDPDGNLLIVAAGGGGAGGAGNQHYIGSSKTKGGDATYIYDGYDGYFFIGSSAPGDIGRNCQAADGGGGGGGGGGVAINRSELWDVIYSGARGGLYADEVRQPGGTITGWSHYDSDGQGGEGGFSYYNREYVSDVNMALNTSTDGSINITWLQDRF